MGEILTQFQINDNLMRLARHIDEELDELPTLGHRHGGTSEVETAQRVRDVHATVALNWNPLTLEQVAGILNPRDPIVPDCSGDAVKEVLNTARAYQLIHWLKPGKVDCLQAEHFQMFRGISSKGGQLRKDDTALFDGALPSHIVPPAEEIPARLEEIFEWVDQARYRPVIKAVVLHYELAYIRPFAEGNGKMARLWMRLQLGEWHPGFYWAPIEEGILARQKDYRRLLDVGKTEGNCEQFVKLMLEILLKGVKRFHDDLSRHLKENGPGQDPQALDQPRDDLPAEDLPEEDHPEEDSSKEDTP